MAFFLTLFMSTWCHRENGRREAIMRGNGPRELSEEQKLEERELADSVLWFRYTV
jgi:hypothetical protein